MAQTAAAARDRRTCPRHHEPVRMFLSPLAGEWSCYQCGFSEDDTRCPAPCGGPTMHQTRYPAAGPLVCSSCGHLTPLEPERPRRAQSRWCRVCRARIATLPGERCGHHARQQRPCVGCGVPVVTVKGRGRLCSACVDTCTRNAIPAGAVRVTPDGIPTRHLKRLAELRGLRPPQLQLC